MHLKQENIGYSEGMLQYRQKDELTFEYRIAARRMKKWIQA